MDSRQSMRSVTGDKAYSELTEYLTQGELHSLEAKMTALPATLPTDDELAKQILNGDWTKLFDAANPHREHFPLQALRCLRAGLIPAMTFSTSQMYFNIFTHPVHANNRIRVEPIFSEQKGKLNATSRKMIDATMLLYSSSYRAYREQKKEEQLRLRQQMQGSGFGLLSILSMLGLDGSKYDTSDWLDPNKKDLSEWDAKSERKFYELLAELPESEKKFLILPDQHFDGKKFLDTNSVIRQINYNLGVNPLSRLRLGGVPVVMIPSRGMMQAFLEATRGVDCTPTPVYRFGLSPVDKLFETMKNGGRDMYQSFVSLVHLTPTKVDGYPASLAYAEPELHDWYHQSRASNIPPNEASLIADIAEFFFHIANTDAKCKEYAVEYAAELSDMEHGTYDPTNIKKNPAPDNRRDQPFYKFWRSIGMKSPSKIPEILSTKVTSIETQTKTLANHFARFLIQHEFALEQKYGLTLESLLKHQIESEFLYLVKTQVMTLLSDLTTDKSLHDLICLFSTDPDSKNALERTGSLQREHILAEINTKIKGNLEAAMLLAYQSKSELLTKLVANLIGNQFRTLLNNDTLTKLKSEHPEAFQSVISALRATREGEALLIDAVKNYEDKPEMFNLLYDKRYVNKVSQLGCTLIYHATVEKNIDLLLRLTNDGAVVTKLPESKKPAAIQKAAALECKDIQALLILAHRHGEGWVDIQSESVERLKRLAAERDKSRNSKNNDADWAAQIIRQSPTELREATYPGEGISMQTNENSLFMSGRKKVSPGTFFEFTMK